MCTVNVHVHIFNVIRKIRVLTTCVGCNILTSHISVHVYSQGQQEKHDYLVQQLDAYSSSSDLPSMPDLLMMGTVQYDSAMFDIESHWTSVVGTPPSELSKKQKDQQEAIWELLHTEVQYIRKLQVVIDVSVIFFIFFLVCCSLKKYAKGVWCFAIWLYSVHVCMVVLYMI